MLREGARGSPGSILQWLARCPPSSWAHAQPFSCVNTLCRSVSYCKQSLAPTQAVKPKQVAKAWITLRGTEGIRVSLDVPLVPDMGSAKAVPDLRVCQGGWLVPQPCPKVSPSSHHPWDMD